MESPWGRGPEYFLDNVQRWVKFNMRGERRKPLFIISICACVIVLLWLVSGVYQVKEGSGAVVLRLGKFVRFAGPGLNYHLPAPFETVIKERMNYSRRVEIGYRSAFGDGSQYVSEESNILTSDENIVRLKCDITWHIKDLGCFVFNVSSPEQAVRRISQSAVREVISESPISDVLSNKKQEIGMKIENLIQRVMDQYQAGIQIEKVNLLAAEPPAEVIDAYRDVQSSRADKEREINQAYGYRNDIVTKAEGEAVKIIQDSESFKQAVYARALGDTKRFEEVLSQYLKNKEITKYRIYTDTMEKVLKGSEKLIVGGGVLPHLPLDKLKERRQPVPIELKD